MTIKRVPISDVVLGGHNYGDGFIEASRYRAGGVALRIVGEDGLPITIISVWLSEPPQEGHFWLKTWGENEGLLVLLSMNNLIEFAEDKIRSIEVNDYGSMAFETKPKGELKTLIDEEIASW